MKWIDALELQQWGERIGARSDLIGIVADLIRASAQEITSFRFLSGDSGQLRGWDGSLDSSGAPPYVPAGQSAWEFGTGSDVTSKADSDYAKRTAKARGVNPSDSTFVFVTARRWDNPKLSIGEWRQQKLQRGEWKDVQLIDAVALEHWLEQNEAVAFRVAVQLLHKAPPTGLRSATAYWEEYSSHFDPNLREEVLLADRQEQAGQLLSQFGTPGAHVWQADSSEEVIAFAVAAIRKSEGTREFIDARTLILDTEDAARQLVVKSGMIFLPRAGARVLSTRLAQQNSVVIAVGRDNPKFGAAVELRRPSTSALANALQTMGLSEEKASYRARTCGRSVTILSRRMGTAVAQQPLWAKDAALIPALLAGAWDSSREADRDSLAVLAGKERAAYPDYEKDLLRFLKLDDPPLEREGAVWKIRAPIDAFAYFGPLISEAHFGHLRAAATSVFTEIDPSLELPESERPYAALSGKTLRHSGWLREGLANTLLIAATLHNELELSNTNCEPEQFVNSLVGQLPGLAADYKVLASLHGELMLLMEAAPRPLVRALEQLLEGDGARIKGIFRDTDPLFSGSPHTGLLWALEVLAWNPKYLADASLTLAKLARVDPGGKLSNRPINSLRDIFVPWHPNTNAPLDVRNAVLNRIVEKEPEVGWQLLTKLLPSDHEVVSPTAKPKYSEAGAADAETVTWGLIGRAYQSVIDRAFNLAGENPERWTTLIRYIRSFNEAHRALARSKLAKLATKLDAEHRRLLWSALRDELALHKAYPTAEWAMKPEQLAPFEDVLNELQPSDTVVRVSWLFDTHLPHIPEVEGRDFDSAQKFRTDAIREVLRESGTQGIIRLANSAALPDHVALAVAEVLEGLEEFATLVDVSVEVDDKLSVFAQVLSGRADAKFGAGWRSRIRQWHSNARWTSEQLTNLLFGFRDERPTWEFVSSLGAEIQEMYWKRKNPWALKGNLEDVQFAIEKYIEVGRATSALQVLHDVIDNVPSETMFRILDAGIPELNASEHVPSSYLTYGLGQIFDELQRRPDVPKIDIAVREYAYLALFGYRERRFVLHEVMAENPRFYFSLIRDAFKPKHGEPREPTPELKAKARHAYRLLSDFHIVPGVKEARVDGNVLRNWIDELRQLGEGEDRAEITDEFIGHALAHAPLDADGAWPHREVRDIIETISSEHVELGIQVERFNSRGVQARALYEGGDRERVLAKQAREWSKTTRAWPRTSAMLNQIAESWERHAQQEDERARHDEMKFES